MFVGHGIEGLAIVFSTVRHAYICRQLASVNECGPSGGQGQRQKLIHHASIIPTLLPLEEAAAQQEMRGEKLLRPIPRIATSTARHSFGKQKLPRPVPTKDAAEALRKYTESARKPKISAKTNVYKTLFVPFLCSIT